MKEISIKATVSEQRELLHSFSLSPVHKEVFITVKHVNFLLLKSRNLYRRLSDNELGHLSPKLILQNLLDWFTVRANQRMISGRCCCWTG